MASAKSETAPAKGAAGASGKPPGWIDPELLERTPEKECICTLCSGVMVDF